MPRLNFSDGADLIVGTSVSVVNVFSMTCFFDLSSVPNVELGVWNVEVQTSDAGYTTSDVVSFEVKAPTAQILECPAGAYPLDTVTIIGTDFGAVPGQVLFGTEVIPWTSWSDDGTPGGAVISFTVPWDAPRVTDTLEVITASADHASTIFTIYDSLRVQMNGLDINCEGYALLVDTFKPVPARKRVTMQDSPLTDGQHYQKHVQKTEQVTLPFEVRVWGQGDTALARRIDLDAKVEQLSQEIIKDAIVVTITRYDGTSAPIVEYYNAYPTNAFATPTYWQRGYQDAEVAVLSFTLPADPGPIGDLTTVEAIKGLGVNDNFELGSTTVSSDVIPDGWEKSGTGQVQLYGSEYIGGTQSCELITAGAESVTIIDANAMPVIVDEHYNFQVPAYLLSGDANLTIKLKCYNSETGGYIGEIVLLENYDMTSSTRPVIASIASMTWMDVLAIAGQPVVGPEDWATVPEANSCKLEITQSGTGIVLLSLLWRGNTEIVVGYEYSGFVALNFPPDYFDGAVPANMDLYLSSPYHAGVFLDQLDYPYVIHGMYGTDDEHVWAVGDFFPPDNDPVPQMGFILFWNGSTWALQYTNADHGLNAVYALDDTHIYAVGTGGIILYSTGSGSWSVVAYPTVAVTDGNFAASISDGGSPTGYSFSEKWTPTVGTSGGTTHYLKPRNHGGHMAACDLTTNDTGSPVTINDSLEDSNAYLVRIDTRNSYRFSFGYNQWADGTLAVYQDIKFYGADGYTDYLGQKLGTAITASSGTGYTDVAPADYPAGTVYARVHYRFAGTCPAAGTRVVYDGDFEQGYWFDHNPWNKWESGMTISRVNDIYNSPTHSYHFHWASGVGGSGSLWQADPMVVGPAHQITVAVAGRRAVWNGTMTIAVNCYDINGTYVGTMTSPAVSPADPYVFESLEYTFTPPEGTESIIIIFQTTVAGGIMSDQDIWLDDVMVVAYPEVYSEVYGVSVAILGTDQRLQTLRCVCAQSTSDILIGTDNGWVVANTAGGNFFWGVNTGQPVQYNAVCPSDYAAGAYWLGADNNEIVLYVQDYGFVVRYVTAHKITGLFAFPDDSVYAVGKGLAGSDSEIYTFDGTNWQQIYTAAAQMLEACSGYVYEGENILYAGSSAGWTYSGKILKWDATNGVLLSSNPVNGNVFACWAYDPTHVWAGGARSGGGRIWLGESTAQPMEATNIFLGQTQDYRSAFASVGKIENGEAAIQWDRLQSSYRTGSARDVFPCYFPLDQNYGRYVLAIAFGFSNTTTGTQGTFRAMLESKEFTALPGGYITESIDLDNPDHVFHEAALMVNRFDWQDVPTRYVSQNAVLNRIVEVIEAVAAADLGCDIWVDYIGLIPIERAYAEIQNNVYNCVIFNSHDKVVLAALDVSLETATAYPSEDSGERPTFKADPNGVCLTMLAINRVESGGEGVEHLGVGESYDDRVSPRLNLTIKYQPIYSVAKPRT